MWRNTQVSLVCEVCGRAFPVKAHRAREARFCGRGCYYRRPVPAPEDRFWAMVEKSDGCWLWTGARLKAGYGTFSEHGRKGLAHCFAYRMAHGPLQHGQVVRHTCDNPPCVRPDHLLAGSVLDNARDCKERGRTARGDRNARAKLTADQVAAILNAHRSGVGQRAIAARYSVCQSAISQIVGGKRWRYLALTGEGRPSLWGAAS